MLIKIRFNNKGITGFDLQKTIQRWQNKNHKKNAKNIKKLNLGSGVLGKDSNWKGWINLDQQKDHSVQVVHDLNKFPYPFKKESIDIIYMSHVLEHLDRPVKVINELYRILKKDGMLIIRVPHYAGNSNWIDVTHRRPYAVSTLKSFMDESFCRLYGAKPFKSVKSRMEFWKYWFYPWNYLIEPLANIKPVYYECVFANIFPPFEVINILEK